MINKPVDLKDFIKETFIQVLGAITEAKEVLMAISKTKERVD